MLILAGLPLSPGPRAGAAENAEAVDPPVAFRPDDFSGAIGSGFHVQTRAVPTQVQAEDPLLLTVSVTGTGNLQDIQRPDLRRLAKHFHIENGADRYLPAVKTREFDYRLRPRTAAVKEIPPLPFVFFNPKIGLPEKGYQRTYSRAIPLTVQPRVQVSPARVEGTAPAPEVPDSVYQLVEGAAVLRQDSPFAVPSRGALAALLVGPPALGGLWYMVWRRCYPDAVREARNRRSRAAQYALKALRRSRKLDAVAQAQQAETVLAGYMRQRLDLHTVEPTPAEVARHLERAGSSTALAQEMARFFGDCDAARFAPGLSAKPDNWTVTATRLVLALEEEAWPS